MNTRTQSPDYLALGITLDTWACVSVMSKRDAQDYLWRLAVAGVPAVLSIDADGKRWHVAIAGGLAASPAAWLCAIRPADGSETIKCPAGSTGQHVRGGRGPCIEDACEEPNGHTGWHVIPKKGYRCDGYRADPTIQHLTDCHVCLPDD